ncbi:hypothetical protein BKA69DRAFT_40904 [Paraphysoderma sedebokerense]|nr:hypothetical protein BKA69DRAFT_40904 [Paraphysoderma sedebokerense]
MVEAVLHGNRGPGRKDMTVEVLDATHPLIKDLNRAELLRKQLPSRAEDIRRAVTDIAHPSQIVTSIKSVLESETVPNKYRLKVKLMAFQPTNLQELTRPFCKPCQQSFPPSPNPPESCPTCKQLLNDQAYIFMFSILVTDDSGEYLPIIIHGDEATQFLRGLKPTNLYNDSRGLQKLGRYLSKLFNQSTNTTPESSASSFTSSTSSFTDNNINAHLLQSVDHELGQSGNNNDETDNIHDDEAVSFSGANRWFDVCVVSYRVPGKEGGTREGEDERDWVVRYKLFGTSIVN